MTTFEDIKIESFPHPDYASEGLKAMIDAAHEYIQSSIVLFASGFDGGQQDMITWLADNKLLSKKGLEFTEDGAQKADPKSSVMTEKYDEKVGVIRDRASQLRMQNENVVNRSFESFDTSNRAFRKVKKVADGLRTELDRTPGEHQLTRQPDGNLHLSPNEESRLLGLILEAVDRVHDTIEDADSGMRRNAGNIRNMIPDLPRNPYGPAPYAGLRTPWTPTASTLTVQPGNGTPNDIVAKARDQLDLNIFERNGDNVPVFVRDNKLYGADYDIAGGKPWCAAFATWVWKKAGYNIGWSNKDYVPAIWNDAVTKGWAGNVSTAQPGDMLVFDWQGDGTPDHVGIVEAVDSSGRIHTIEGNSSDSLKRNSYNTGNGALVGVVRPPAPEVQSARAS